MTLAKLDDWLAARAQDLSDEVIREVWGSDGYDLEHMESDDFTRRVQANVRDLIYCVCRSDDDAAEAATTEASEIGYVRALQGVPVDKVIQSWLAAEHVIMRTIFEYGADCDHESARSMVLDLNEMVRRIIDVTTTAYNRARAETFEQYDHIVTELVGRLAGRLPADFAKMREDLRSIGADPDARYSALAVTVLGTPTEVSSRIRRAFFGALAAIAQTRVLISHAPRSLVLIPQTHVTVERTVSQLREHIASSKSDTLVVGMSRRSCLIKDLPQLCAHAELAMDVALHRGDTSTVTILEEILPEAFILRNPDLAQLLRERMQALVERPELVQTLVEYLSHGQSARATARALRVHHNTIPYRLHLIEGKLQRPLQNSLELSDVILGLRLLDLIHRP